MSSRFLHTTGFAKFIIIFEFILVSYLLYSLTKNVYNSYTVDRYIATFERENSSIEEENRQKTEDYLYFTSEEYIDKIAKQNLGLVNPGEEVIVLSPDVLSVNEGASAVAGSDYAKETGMTNPRKWWQFFFGE